MGLLFWILLSLQKRVQTDESRERLLLCEWTKFKAGLGHKAALSFVQRTARDALHLFKGTRHEQSGGNALWRDEL